MIEAALRMLAGLDAAALEQCKHPLREGLVTAGRVLPFVEFRVEACIVVDGFELPAAGDAGRLRNPVG